MRKEILGLVVYSLCGLETAHAQMGYQEPLPIQGPGVRYAPMPARYAPYPAPAYPNYFQAAPQAAWPVANAPVQYAPLATPVEALALAQAIAPPPLPGPGTTESTGPVELSPPQVLQSDDVPTAPADPPEPFLVGPEGTWKPRKGYQIYGTAEYIYWKVQGQPLPGNLSLSVANATPAPQLESHGLNGGRFFLGAWLNDNQELAFEAGYFFLASRPTSNVQTYPGSALANIPIFDGILSESSVVSSSTNLWGSEANLRYQICKFNRGSVTGYIDLLAGFRYVDLSESLNISSTTAFGPAPVLLSDATIVTYDSFGTHNHFFAGQLGIDTTINVGRIALTGFAKLAMGNNHETVNIAGNTQVSAPLNLGNFSAPGGFYAQPSNIGVFRHDEFTILPETGINIGYKFNDHWKIGAGYTFMYLSHVVRPGAQIDATAGGATRPPLFLVGGAPAQAAFNGFNETSFWAQGINLTVEVSY